MIDVFMGMYNRMIGKEILVDTPETPIYVWLWIIGVFIWNLTFMYILFKINKRK